MVIKENPRKDMKHVCDAMQPKLLRKRLEWDLRFSHASLRKDLKAFGKQIICLSDAFQLVDSEKPSFADGDTKLVKRRAQPSNSSRAPSATKMKEETTGDKY